MEPAMPDELLLYGRTACHLCLEAVDLLNELHLPHTPLDIDDVTEWGVRYGLRIPVLHCSQTHAELDWPFDAAQVWAWLAARDSALAEDA